MFVNTWEASVNFIFQEQNVNKLNKIELARKDLDAFAERKRKLQAEISILTENVCQLNQVYAEHDKLLGKKI